MGGGLSYEASFQAVGLDFGTTTSLMAQRSGLGPVNVLPLGRQRNLLPSVVSPVRGGYLVGEDADELPPDQVVRSVKRAITDGTPTVRLGGHADGVELNADEVIGAVLNEIVRRGRERGIDLPSQPVVRIGCPAAWTRQQRQRLIDVSRAADLPVSHATLVDEPVAAGVAWLTAQYLTSAEPVRGRLLVFDMGGGTLDVAVLDVEGGARPRVRVLASGGLPQAGDSLDQEIADTLRERLGADISSLPNPAMAEGALLLAARQAKERLSRVESFPIRLPVMYFGAGTPTIRVSRDELDELFTPQLQWAEQLVWQQLRLARLTHLRGASTQDTMRARPDQLAADVTHVLLAGGMSNVPYVRRRLRELFPYAWVFDNPGPVTADESIVAGLADTIGYDELSMHRPSFDVLLEWPGGGVTLYEAYTPLFDGWQIQSGQSLLGYTRRLDRSGFPQDGWGRLRVVTPSGETLALRDAPAPGRTPVVHPSGVDIRFGSHQMTFKLYTDGRIHLTDGAGFENTVLADGWQAILGPDSAPEPQVVPAPRTHYPFNREELNLPEVRSPW